MPLAWACVIVEIGYPTLRRQFCALYIPLGEFAMFLAIIPVVAHALSNEERRTARTLEAGGLFALAIAGGYATAYLLLEIR